MVIRLSSPIGSGRKTNEGERGNGTISSPHILIPISGWKTDFPHNPQEMLEPLAVVPLITGMNPSSESLFIDSEKMAIAFQRSCRQAPRILHNACDTGIED